MYFSTFFMHPGCCCHVADFDACSPGIVMWTRIVSLELWSNLAGPVLLLLRPGMLSVRIQCTGESLACLPCIEGAMRTNLCATKRLSVICTLQA